VWPVRLYSLLANWYSGHKYRQCGQFASTKQRLPEEGARLAGRVFYHLRPRLWITYGIVGRNVTRPGFDPLCQFANKRLLANWHSGHEYRQCGQFASTVGDPQARPQVVKTAASETSAFFRESLFCRGELATLMVLMTAVPVRQ